LPEHLSASGQKTLVRFWGESLEITRQQIRGEEIPDNLLERLMQVVRERCLAIGTVPITNFNGSSPQQAKPIQEFGVDPPLNFPETTRRIGIPFGHPPSLPTDGLPDYQRELVASQFPDPDDSRDDIYNRLSW